MKEHPLDNVVWSALTTVHGAYAEGRGLARQYPREMAPFAAVAEPSDAAYADLASILPPGFEARLFRPSEEAAPNGWERLSARPIVQMTADDAPPAALDHPFVELGIEGADDMLALADAAKPGPFGRKTILLGAYVGIRNAEGRGLVAMGGERFRLRGFAEVSAICVHPSARGRGLGAAITAYLMRTALARGDVPFLHVFPENPAARLYAKLGFVERARPWVIWRRPRNAGQNVPG
jgi:GNAT superfamily N-acetyltransferase